MIDDSNSIIRCTNKVYLAELLQGNGVPDPQDRDHLLGQGLGPARGAAQLPVVLKIPDGSFSRGVAKVADRAELERMVRGMLEDSDLILAQEFMYTEYDWRVGVLDGEPLFVSQYMMARKHWQIIRHTEGGRPIEGGFQTLAVAARPPRRRRRAVGPPA